MEFVEVPNTAQLELVMTSEGQRIENVLHYTKASPWDATQLAQLCASAIASWSANLRTVMPTTCSLILTRATDLASQTGPAVEYAVGLPLAGSVSGGALPNNNAIVIKKSTYQRGRSFRGRIYHGPLNRSQTVGSSMDPTALTGIISRWLDMVNLTVGADEANLVVVSRVSGGQQRATGIATLVTGLSSDGIIDSQRRRLPGRGR